MAEPVSLPPGSDNPPDQAGQPFTEEDVETVGLALCLNASEPVCPRVCRDCAQEGSVVLRALAEAGRLLPAGTPQITEEWGVRLVDTRLGTRSSVFVSRDMAWANVEYHRRIYATRQTYVGRADLLRREVRSWPDGSQWTGPWEVVQ